MTPAELRRHLATYADGECEAELRAALEVHLAAYPEDAAEVERWRALRRCLGRVLNETGAPAGLAARVRASLAAGATAAGTDVAHGPRAAGGVDVPAAAEHRLQRGPASRRAYRLGISGLAAAAMVMLAVTLWPRGAAATTVEASRFADIYRTCALANRDELGVCGAPACECAAAVHAKCGFACPLPDLGGGGKYRLAGGCPCGPGGVRTVHVFYAAEDEPQRVVSLFATERPVRLAERGAECATCPRAKRCYRRAKVDSVALVAWEEGGRTYVLCGESEPEQLARLAEEITVPKADGGAARPGCAHCEQAETQTGGPK
ncbi:MAG: hypothetical protein AB1716_13335 [Planctomycetota bacterium]